MSISFPASPTVGQIYQNWVWSGSSWDAVNPGLTLQLRKQIFTASGAYTPSPGMFQAEVEVVGGGGGGGAASAQGAANTITNGGGGGAGSYSKRLCTSTMIGGSQTVTIGAGGAGGTTNAAVGAAGGAANGTATSFGTLCIANGGGGGQYQLQTGSVTPGPGMGGAAGTGDIALQGNNGGGPVNNAASGFPIGGAGANSPYGAGGYEVYLTAATNSNGQPGRGYGSGGGGGVSFQSTGFASGGAGAPGLCIVTEYCWVKGSAVAAQALSGALVPISQAIVSTAVASVDFTTGIDNTYDQYQLDFYNVGCSAGSATASLRVSPDHGATWDTSNNYTSAINFATSTGNTYGGATGGGSVPLHVGTYTPAVDITLSGRARFWLPTLLQRRYGIFEGAQYNTGGALATGQGSFVYTNAANAITGVRFFWTSGNVTSGTFKLFGIQK